MFLHSPAMQAFFTLLGFIAGTLTTVAFLPQVKHTYKCKSADELSWTMLITFSIGVFCWFVYGIYMHSWPMIFANSITLLIQIFIIGMKVRYSNAKGIEVRD